MSWGRVDDKLHSHHKVRKISRKPIERLQAMGLWVLCMSHCCDVLSDGFVDRELAIEKAGSEKAADALAGYLVAAGMWEPADGGWVFHDWHLYGPTRAKAAAAQAQRVEAASRGGYAKAAAKNTANGMPARQAIGSVPADHVAAGNVLPVPVPVPVPVKEETPLPPGVGIAPVLSVQDPAHKIRRGSTHCPPSTATPEAVDAWCRAHGLPPASSVPDLGGMLDWHRKNGKARADWLATWRDWQRSPYQQPQGANGVRPSPQPGPAPGEARAWEEAKPTIGG